MPDQALHVAHRPLDPAQPVRRQVLQVIPGLVAIGFVDGYLLDVQLLEQLCIVPANQGHQGRVEMLEIRLVHELREEPVQRFPSNFGAICTLLHHAKLLHQVETVTEGIVWPDSLKCRVAQTRTLEAT